MCMHNLHRYVTGILFLVLLLAGDPAGAQENPVVSSDVSVSGAEASLRMEFEDGSELAVELRDGTVRIDGDEVGSYSPGDELDRAWRELLGESVREGPAALSRSLHDWQPPSVDDADARASGERIVQAFEERLNGDATVPAPAAPRVFFQDQPQEVLQALLERGQRLQQLTEVLQELTVSQLDIRVAENVTVEEGEVIQATLAVVDGNVEVRGTVEGHVIALGGNVHLADAGRIEGDLRWRNGTVEGDESIVAGQMAQVEDFRSRLEEQIRERVQREVLADLSRPDREEAAATDAGWFAQGISPIRNVVRGLAELVRTAVAFGVLLLLGGGVLYFFPRHLKVMGDTARAEPGRSALVGAAGFVLLFPAWIIGIVALAISIIGIPLLLGWAMAPLVAMAAVFLGFVAVAFAAGEAVAEREHARLDWMERTNPLHQLALGLAVFLASFAVAGVLAMAGPWLGFLRGLFVAMGVLGIMAAATVGFGAVLLSRAGRLSPAERWRMRADRRRAGGPDVRSREDEGDAAQWDREFHRERKGGSEAGSGAPSDSGGSGEDPEQRPPFPGDKE